MKTKDSFLFYRSYIDAIEKLPEQRRYAFIRAIVMYALDGTKPDFFGAEDIAFGLMKANIDSCNKRYAASVENGKKGGRPPKYVKKKTQEKPSKNPNENVNDDVNETNHHLHDDYSVSDGSPLNAEPPSTQTEETRWIGCDSASGITPERTAAEIERERWHNQ